MRNEANDGAIHSIGDVMEFAGVEQTDDATPSYRGYRRQSLYVLHRLFCTPNPDNTSIQLEGSGKEDLSVERVDGTLLEVVQVKDLTAPITVTAFKPSFYKRIARHCSLNSATKITIATYGPVGRDLVDAKNGDRRATARSLESIRKQLLQGTGDQYLRESSARDVASRILARIEFEPIEEQALHTALIAKLQSTVAGIDTSHAFDLLTRWMFDSAENKRSITKKAVSDKLLAIGTFLSSRSAFHEFWNGSIHPLEDAVIDVDERDRLRRTFFAGGRTTFAHILASVDVHRTAELNRLHSAFSTNRIVVIHSASGQGKTTLAYRYLKDFTPDVLRLSVTPAKDTNQANLIALAIQKHVQALEIPAVVYVDVRPGDYHWIDLVQAVSSSSFVSVLVTIREEDWARCRSSSHEFSHSSVDLAFTESDGRTLYENLTQSIPTTSFLDFNDAWSQLGIRKTLFEFVYSLTQSETLAARLKTQVTAIQAQISKGERDPAEGMLLRIVSNAGAYDATINTATAIAQCQLRCPEYSLQQLENEFLIRVGDQGARLEGYHAIRSELLSQFLADPILSKRELSIAECVPHILEEDLEAFLLCAFSRHRESIPLILGVLSKIRPSSWTGICGIVRSLLWLGVRTYVVKNEDVIRTAYAEDPAAWWLTLNWDLSGACGPNGFLSVFDSLRMWRPVLESGRSLREQLSDVSEIYRFIADWLSSQQSLPAEIQDPQSASACGEVLYWMSKANIAARFSALISPDSLQRTLELLPLSAIHDLLSGVYAAFPEVHKTWSTRFEPSLIARVRKDSQIFSLEDGDTLTAHYIVRKDRVSSLLFGDIQANDGISLLNAITMERVRLIRHLFPGRRSYGAAGYGHRSSLIPLPFDASVKTAISAESIHHRLEDELNVLARGIVDFDFRPRDWDAFANELHSLRSGLTDACAELKGRVELAMNHSTTPPEFSNEFEGFLKLAIRGVRFPQGAVDEWGFLSEGISGTETRRDTLPKYTASARLQPLWEAMRRYFGAMLNFLNVASRCTGYIWIRRRYGTSGLPQSIREVFSKDNIDDSTVRLAAINGVEALVSLDTLRNTVSTKFARLTTSSPANEVATLEATVERWISYSFPSYRGSPRPKRKISNVIREQVEPTRNRIKQELQRLKRAGITARIAVEQKVNSYQSSMWITFDVPDPEQLQVAAGVLWESLALATAADRHKPIWAMASDTYWQKIGVIPTVQRVSLHGHAFHNFKGALSWDIESRPPLTWQLLSEPVPSDIIELCGVSVFEPDSVQRSINAFCASYTSLFEHLDHLADILRNSSNLDELGFEIIQSHLTRQTDDLQRLFNSILTTWSELVEAFGRCDIESLHPNRLKALQNFMDTGSVVTSLVPDSKSTVTLETLKEWRDRLGASWDSLSAVQTLWAAGRGI